MGDSMFYSQFFLHGEISLTNKVLFYNTTVYIIIGYEMLYNYNDHFLTVNFSQTWNPKEK